MKDTIKFAINYFLVFRNDKKRLSLRGRWQRNEDDRDKKTESGRNWSKKGSE